MSVTPPPLSGFNSHSFSIEHAPVRKGNSDYNALIDAIIDLYLNVKIRNSEEIDDYDSNKLGDEKKELMDKDPVLIVDYIK